MWNWGEILLESVLNGSYETTEWEDSPVTQTVFPHECVNPAVPNITLVPLPGPIITMCSMLLCWKSFLESPMYGTGLSFKTSVSNTAILFVSSLVFYSSIDEWSQALCPSPKDSSLGLHKSDTIYISIRPLSITVINKGSFRPLSLTINRGPSVPHTGSKMLFLYVSPPFSKACLLLIYSWKFPLPNCRSISHWSQTWRHLDTGRNFLDH